MLKRLRMNLQHFAEDATDPSVTNPKDDPKNELDSEQPDASGNGGKNDGGDPVKDGEPKFTQAQLDAILADRLAREKAKAKKAEEDAQKEAERQKLAEEEKYKELASTLQEQLDAMKGDALKANKKALMLSAGYTEEQVEKYEKYVDGNNEEELKASVDVLKADIPPKPRPADPIVGNGGKNAPKKTNLEDKGRTAYQRLKESGRLRRK